MQELREELEKRGLDTKGLKAELVERLETALAADTAPAEAGAEAEPPLDDAPKPASEHVPVSAPQEVAGSSPLLALVLQRMCIPRHAAPLGLNFPLDILLVLQALGAVSNGAAKPSKEAAPAKDEAAELEKRKARAARFGVPLNMSDDKKRELRAQRCCHPHHFYGLPNFCSLHA